MSLKKKLLGLALLASLATAAFVVVTASANDEGHWVTTGTTKGTIFALEGFNHKLEWSVEGWTSGIICDQPTWEEHIDTETLAQLIFFPSFDKCHTTGEGTLLTIKSNGCAVGFSVAKGTTNTTEQTVDLLCVGKPLEILHPKCTITIGSQSDLTTATYTTITVDTKHQVTADLDLKVAIDTEGACGVAKKTGRLKGSIRFEATDDKGLAAHLTAT